MQVNKELWDEFQNLKDRVINLDKLIELEKPEPTLQDKVRDEWVGELSVIHDEFEMGCWTDEIGERKNYTRLLNELKRILGIKTVGMLKLQVIADLVNEGKQFAIQDNCYGIAYSFPEGKPEVVNWTGFKTQIGSPRFKDEQAALKAIELMNIPYFEGDITLEELR
jgi:hypothetical protein